MSTFIDAYFSKQSDNLSLTSDIVRISNNIINICPEPIFIKEIDNIDYIKNEFELLSLSLNDSQIYVSHNQDPSINLGIFTSQNAYVPRNNILSINNDVVNLLKKNIFDGINDLLVKIYNFNGEYEYKILNSWMQKYKNGNFLSAHNHETGISLLNEKKENRRVFSIAYYIDDGDPDLSQSYSGVITFISSKKEMTHIRPKSGTLLIWEKSLIHLVNPFFSKTNGHRFMLSANIQVEY